MPVVAAVDVDSSRWSGHPAVYSCRARQHGHPDLVSLRSSVPAAWCPWTHPHPGGGSMSNPISAESICSRAECASTRRPIPSTGEIRRSTRFDRVKVWHACDDHVDYLHDYLASREFPVLVAPLGTSSISVPSPAPVYTLGYVVRISSRGGGSRQIAAGSPISGWRSCSRSPARCRRAGSSAAMSRRLPRTLS